MNRVWSNIKHGARLALAALAVQFAVSFGNFHCAAAWAAPAIRPALQPDHAPRRQPSNGCKICAVAAFADTMLFATPPLLQLPQAIEFLHLTTDAEFIHLKSAHGAVQPHPAPLS